MKENSSTLTKAQVPRLMMITLPERSGVVAGKGPQASSVMEGTVEVAYTGKVPLTGSGKTDRYV